MNVLLFIVAVSTWLVTPPPHLRGLIVYYGSQRLVQANADYHGYDLEPTDNCGLSAIAPMTLGQVYWIKLPDNTWMRCLAVDVAARRDYYTILYRNDEIAEVSDNVRRAFAERGKPFKNGINTEIFIGPCPPPADDLALTFRPPLVWETDPAVREPSLWPYHPQEYPGECLHSLN